MQQHDSIAPLELLQKSRIRATINLDTEEFLALQWALNAVALMPLPTAWQTREHRAQYEYQLRELSIIASKMDDSRTAVALEKASHRTALVPIAEIAPADQAGIRRAAEEAGLLPPPNDVRDEPVIVQENGEL